MKTGEPKKDLHQIDDAEFESRQRVGPLTNIPEILEGLGCNSQEILAAAGLGPGALSTPDNRIAFAQFGELLHACVEGSGCEYFPLLLAQRARLAELGLPGQLVSHSPNLGAAIRMFATFQHLNNQGMVKFLLERDGIATLGTVVYHRGTRFTNEILSTEIAATLVIIRELMGDHWSPEQVHFSWSRPKELSPYRRFFRAPCKFDSDRTALVFPAPLLEQKLPTSNPVKLRMLEAQARARDDFGLVFRLRRALRTLLVAKAASGDEVAKILSMHRRTLNRKLKEEGTTFQELLDEARFEAACQMLDNSHLAVTEIADSLGYAETSAFSRAFRRWSGASPVERRQSVAQRI